MWGADCSPACHSPSPGSRSVGKSHATSISVTSPPWMTDADDKIHLQSPPRLLSAQQEVLEAHACLSEPQNQGCKTLLGTSCPSGAAAAAAKVKGDWPSLVPPFLPNTTQLIPAPLLPPGPGNALFYLAFQLKGSAFPLAYSSHLVHSCSLPAHKLHTLLLINAAAFCCGATLYKA